MDPTTVSTGPGVNPLKCAHYAQFASNLKTTEFDVVYWLLFLLVVFMLFCASWYYSRSMDLVDKFPADSPERRRQMKKCMVVCGICTVVSVVAVVMETFALLALQFCDGEDLMMLYWSTWTMLQIGSVIAIFGVILAIYHSLRGGNTRELSPRRLPWALALGTPVLVVAGLGHFFNSALHKRAKSIRAKKTRGRSASRSRNASFSQTPTLRTPTPDDGETSYNAKLIGYTAEGGPIIQFSEKPKSLHGQSSLLGTSQDGQVIVSFKKEMSVVVGSAGGEKELGNLGPPGTASPGVRPKRPPPQPLLSADEPSRSRILSDSEQTIVAPG